MKRAGDRYSWMKESLRELNDAHLYRKPRIHENLQTTRAVVSGKPLVLFSSNDYLGLSEYPDVIQAAGEALALSGAGARSARLISGTTQYHTDLEQAIARFLGKENALVFSAGYLANLGTVSALAGPDDLIVMDKLNHASLIDAARMSGARIRVYPHRNVAYLENILQRAERKGRVWIVSDGVFSMDGDLAPLPELVALKQKYDAYLVLDEAHGIGVFGPGGRGISEHFGLLAEVDVFVGTLSKSIGVLGGFVAGSQTLIEYIINHARTFLFATALPPAICRAARESFALIEKLPVLRKELWRNVDLMVSGLKELGAPLLETVSPIVPVVFGDEARTLEAYEYLYDQGFFAPAVRYPTVPKGKARLRITVSRAHSEEQITNFLHAFRNLLRRPEFRK